MQGKIPDSEYPTDAQMEEMQEAYESDGKHEILKVLQRLKQEREEVRNSAAARDPITSSGEAASASEPPARLHREPRAESD